MTITLEKYLCWQRNQRLILFASHSRPSPFPNGGSERSGIYLSFMTTLITMCLMDAISQTRAKDVYKN